jgi:hypothetical protein
MLNPFRLRFVGPSHDRQRFAPLPFLVALATAAASLVTVWLHAVHFTTANRAINLHIGKHLRELRVRRLDRFQPLNVRQINGFSCFPYVVFEATKRPRHLARIEIAKLIKTGHGLGHAVKQFDQPLLLVSAHLSNPIGTDIVSFDKSESRWPPAVAVFKEHVSAIHFGDVVLLPTCNLVAGNVGPFISQAFNHVTNFGHFSSHVCAFSHLSNPHKARVALADENAVSEK